jgi:hypothetical protein
MRGYIAVLLVTFIVTGCDVYDRAMDSAVSSGDHGEISRAFHAATYNKRSGLESTRRSLTGYLENSDPVVRFLAAKYLYVLGDSSGYNALIDIIESGDDVALHKRDLRLWAIDLLRQYRDRRGAPEIYRFFTETRSIDAFNALLRLEGSEAPVDPLSAYPDARPYPSTTVFSVALKNPHLATELASATFEDPKCPDIYAEQSRQIAAWALLRAGAGEPYFSYLRDQAEKAISGERPPAGKDSNQYRKAFEYLASVSGKPVKDLLVRALESSDDRVVQVALVNLIFNHNDLPAARPRLISELEQRTINLGSEFTLQLVAALDDPKLEQAANEFSKMDSSGQWRMWSVARKGWPIYNWIDDYVVILNETANKAVDSTR